MTIVPIAEWRPDQPDLVDPGAETVKNVLARSANAYGPMSSLAVYSNALTARCQGAVGVTDSSGNANAFAGDASKLYQAVAGSIAWSDVSKAAGYTTGAQERWAAAFFTPERVLMTNFADPIQSFVLGSSTLFSDLSANAPKARYLAVIRDFVMAFNVFDATDGARPTRAHWCAIGDPTSWPAIGSSAAVAVQSDNQDINLGPDFGWGMGIVGGLGSADGAAFFERGIARIAYTGPPSVFGFYAVEGARGTPAPGSIAQLGAFVIYLGDDDLYSFDGSSSTPLGAEKFAKTFYARVDQSQMHRISSAFDPINKIYFMAYPGAGNTNGNCNEVIAYNWLLKRATLIDGLGDIEMIFRSLSFGSTLDQLDAVNASLDALPFSLDSRAWTGGKLLLSAFDGNHKLNYFTGTSLAATVDTSEAQLIQSRRAFVNSVRPLVDGGTPSVAIGTRERQVDAVTWGGAVAINAVGECPQRSSARYHRARITMPAGATWSNIYGIDVPEDAVADDGDR
jgi:hypothetical protein